MLTFLPCVLLCLACVAHGDVIYPAAYAQQKLAARLHCQEKETQHFHYSSHTKLWGSIGGDIVVTGDVALHCQGDDRGGRFESEALKYLAEISNLIIEENKQGNERREGVTSRRKRGVKEFFSDSWKKIKNFFNRVFRGQQPPAPDRNEEEDEKESSAEDLSSLYTVPFQFLQLANGSIPEIRFAENEVEDGRIRNFKRHLVDAFATQLNFDQKQNTIIETSVTGEHDSLYNITVHQEKSPINLAGFAVQPREESTVTVEKLVREDDIRKLAPSEALNDRQKMQITMQQLQVFKGGKLISSSGTSSIVILPDSETKGNRRKRETEDDLTSSLRAYSAFDIKLQRRKKRSAKETARLEMHRNLAFVPVSRYAEKEGSPEKQKLRRLQETSGDKTRLLESLMTGRDHDEYDEKMQLLSEMIDREVNLKLDREPESASDVVRNVLSTEKMQEMCTKNFSHCKDFLQLLALAGGPEAETVFLSLLGEKKALTSLELRTVAAILSDLSNPSTSFLNTLAQLISRTEVDRDVLGSLCLAAGSLGSKAADDISQKIADTLTDILKQEKSQCQADALLIDVLEAVGNLGCTKTVPFVLEVSRTCKENGGVQIACAHALRQHCDQPSVKLWMQNLTADSDCDVTDAIVGALMDKIQDQQVDGDNSNWPRNGFNEVDENLKHLLVTSKCSVEDIILYFSKKKDPVANGIAKNYFGPESEPWNPRSSTRHKRALWDNLNCNEWTEDDKFRPIQDKEEFASDRAIYNKRKSCLAFRRLGIKGANAEIYAGMFAGVKEPSEPPRYKLFTKFVSSVNFLDHEMEIGSFYFYHHSGETKAYVRILGKTRQEFRHQACIPTDLKYRPIKHIPLYLVNVASVEISLGIHLSSQLSMGTECPSISVYQIEPMTSFRIGGEAIGTVGLARGGVNLGGHFNYKLQFTFTPTPNMCVGGSHGYDPMGVSVETFFQLWNSLKEDWGRHRVWKPKLLSWDIKKGNMKAWFDDVCLKTDSESVLSSDRELER